VKVRKVLGLLLAILMMALGLAAVITPDRLLPFARFTTTPNGIYVAAAIRFLIGLILILAAGSSRFPTVLRVLGALVICAAIATIAMGSSGAQQMAERLERYAPNLIRAIGVFLIAVGGFVAYAMSGRRTTVVS
jgi:uncharacterized protein YjeT (DUF2065 family)